MIRRPDTTMQSSLILQVTPEIADEFREVKIWQDGIREMYMHTPGPTSARMKFSRTTSVASLVERVNSFIAEEMGKIQREANQNMQNHLAAFRGPSKAQ